MRMTRGRDWAVNIFLWVCPLAGLGVFVGAVLAGRVLPTANWTTKIPIFDVPKSGVIWLMLCAIAAALVVAWIARRVLGLLAAVSLVLFFLAAAGWIGSYQATGMQIYCGVGGVSGEPVVHFWSLRSQGGGMLFVASRNYGRIYYELAAENNLAPGRDRNFSWIVAKPVKAYPVSPSELSDAPKWGAQLGFSATVKPKQGWSPRHGGTLFALALPYWFLCLLAAPLPLAWVLRFRRRRRIARRAGSGLCKSCGYDLRATPEVSGALLPICPECGAAATTAAVASGSPSQTKN
jgi:hypothetical protein